MPIQRLPGILQMKDGGTINRAELNPGNRSCADGVAAVVIVTFAMNLSASRFSHSVYHAAQSSAVLGIDTAGFDLHFLKVLEHGVLARLPLKRTCCHNAIHNV